MSFPQLHDQFLSHARDEFPRESCGLVVYVNGDMVYRRCRNRALGSEHFILHEEDFATCEDEGEIHAVVHSHPNASANPSMADRVMCARMNVPWIIVGWPSGAIVTCEPDGFHPPLLGREFAHGILDCYTLVRDYYKEVCGLDIPNFEREDGWWERGENLYLDNFEKAGFVRVDGPPKLHDGILMQVLSDRVNHAAVYVGDGQMMHHLYGRQSCRDVYGGYWLRHTHCIVRHRSFLDAA